VSADNFNSIVLFPLEETPFLESVPIGMRGDEGKAGHYGNLAIVVPYKTLAEIGEKLAGGRRVRVVRSVKEDDMQCSHSQVSVLLIRKSFVSLG